LASIVCGLIGPFIVTRRMVFISGGLSHTAFGGLGIAYWLNVNPLYGATAFVLLAAAGIGFSEEKTDKSDLLIGILWAMGMAIGIVFIHLTPGYAPDLMTFLFGNILTVPRSDIFIMAILVLFVTLSVLIFYKGFVAIAFDEEYAKAMKLPVRYLNIGLLLLIGLSIITLIQVVGIILVIALLTIPVAIAEDLSVSFKRIMIISIILGISICWAGLFVSYFIEFPSGASIILIGGILLVLVKIYKRFRFNISKEKT
jgi:zinc transport system permease protein